MSDKIGFPSVPNWRDSPQAAAIHKAYDTCGFDGLTHRQVEVVLDALDVGGFLAALSAPSEPVPDGPRVWEGVELPAGGQTRQRWRSRDAVSGGAVVVNSREEAERWSNREPDPFGPNHPCVVETAKETTWPDGTQLLSAWSEVVEEATP